MSKLKLKSLLEGYAWERNADGSLPTLADTTAAHARKMQEDYYGNRRPKFGPGSPYNDEPGFGRNTPDRSKIVNTEWDAIVDEYNNKPGFKVETSTKPGLYNASITNTETGDYFEVTFKRQNWTYYAKIGGKGMMFVDKPNADAQTQLIDKFNEVCGNVTEAVDQEEADRRWNDPIRMGMRDISKPATTKSAKAPRNFYREKLTALEAQRKQLEFDMEQEAEPEGGPIADYYGDALNHIDQQIDSIRKKMNTNEVSESETEPRWQDSDGDGKWYEPEDVNEAAYKNSTNNELASHIGQLKSEIKAEKDPKKLDLLRQDLKDCEAELKSRKQNEGLTPRDLDLIAKFKKNLNESATRY